jgi:hypothetical protein
LQIRISSPRKETKFIPVAGKTKVADRRTFNGAISVDLEVFQRRQSMSRVFVIIVRPRSN